jgi:rifampin ADP-ribosylating transferase
MADRGAHRSVSDRLDEGTTAHPTPFEVHSAGNVLHGTKANLAVGDVLVAGRPSNFDAGRVMNHVYVTAAVWGAELALGAGRGRIYFVEPHRHSRR